MESIYMSIRHRLTEQEWNRIKDMLPPERSGKRGRPATRNNRQIIDALVWILRTGAPWRDWPDEFGPWQSVYTRFRRWKTRGIWQQIFELLSQDQDEEAIIIDSSVIRAHQHAAGAKGGNRTKR